MNTVLYVLYVPYKGRSYYWHLQARSLEAARLLLTEKYGPQGREELFDGIAEFYCRCEQTFLVEEDD